MSSYKILVHESIVALKRWCSEVVRIAMTSLLFAHKCLSYCSVMCWPPFLWRAQWSVSDSAQTYSWPNRPYSEQRYDRYESEAVRDRLTMFPMASAVKSW